MNIFEDKNFIKKLNDDLKNGAVVCFVTDTVWGVGCLPTNKTGVDKIYQTKGRDRTKPLILMSNKLDNLIPYTNGLSQKAQELANKYFPGAITIIAEKSNLTPDFVSANKDTIGIRVPNNKFFSELCSVIDGNVLATTSANLSSQPSAKNYLQACAYLENGVDYIFPDCGFSCDGLESTVVLALDENIKILRQGAVKITQS